MQATSIFSCLLNQPTPLSFENRAAPPLILTSCIFCLLFSFVGSSQQDLSFHFYFLNLDTWLWELTDSAHQIPCSGSRFFSFSSLDMHVLLLGMINNLLPLSSAFFILTCCCNSTRAAPWFFYANWFSCFEHFFLILIWRQCWLADSINFTCCLQLKCWLISQNCCCFCIKPVQTGPPAILFPILRYRTVNSPSFTVPYSSSAHPESILTCPLLILNSSSLVLCSSWIRPHSSSAHPESVLTHPLLQPAKLLLYFHSNLVDYRFSSQWHALFFLPFWHISVSTPNGTWACPLLYSKSLLSLSLQASNIHWFKHGSKLFI